MTTPSIKRVGAFSPTSISGCQLWLDGGDPTGTGSQPANGANVSIWVDKSGNGKNATEGGTTPTYSSATRSIVFGGAGYFTNSTLSLPLSTRSVFIVCRQTSRAADFEGIMLLSSPSVSEIDFESATTIPYFASGSNVTVGDTAFSIYNRGNYVHNYRPYILTPLGIYVDIFGSLSGTLYINGTSNSTDPDSSSVGTANGYILGARKFSGTTLSTFFNGIIYEIIIYNTALTAAQQQQTEGYLAQKWGLRNNLPGGHPGITSIIYPTPRRTGTVNMTVNLRPYYTEFSLTSISGCQLWLDAADSTTITTVTGVSQWNDKSGNVNNLTQGTTGSQPSYASNLITFDSNKYLNIPASVMNNIATWSLFFAINPISSSNWIMAKQKDFIDTYNVLSMTLNTATSGAILTGSTGFLYWRSMNAGTQAVSTAAITTSTIQIVNLTYDGTNLYFYKNGVLEKTTAGTFAIQNDITPSTYTLGVSIYPGGQILNLGVTNFRLGEMIVYNTFLNTTQRQEVESYLAQKWGLASSLPSGHLNVTQPVGTPSLVRQIKRTIGSTNPAAKYSAFFSSANNTLSMPSNAVFELGTNNHTIEFWFYHTSRGLYDTIFAYGNNPPQWTSRSNYYINMGSNQFLVILGNGSGGWEILLSGGTLVTLNTWHHYALVRNGSTFTLYINGTSRGTATTSAPIGTQVGSLVVGSYGVGGADGFTGYISNFRFVVGTAVYTSNFTPPTSPLTAIPNTQLLIQGLVDRSPNAFTLTNTNNVTLSTTLSPFA
jgi:hypothetical protein